jgi:hypothetical protein
MILSLSKKDNASRVPTTSLEVLLVKRESGENPLR